MEWNGKERTGKDGQGRTGMEWKGAERTGKAGTAWNGEEWRGAERQARRGVEGIEVEWMGNAGMESGARRSTRKRNTNQKDKR